MLSKLSGMPRKYNKQINKCNKYHISPSEDIMLADNWRTLFFAKSLINFGCCSNILRISYGCVMGIAAFILQVYEFIYYFHCEWQMSCWVKYAQIIPAMSDSI